MASRFFTTSLIIHVIVVTLLGGVVLFRATRDPGNFTSVGSADGFLSEQPAEQAGEAEATEFEEPSEAAAISPSQTVVPASAISSLSDSAASWSTSASMDYAPSGNLLNSARALPSGTGAGTGSGTGVGGGGKGKMGGTLFGVKVEAKKLGVVLDVSGSAHPFLLHAINELEKSFQGSPIVLYTGCGMSANATAKDYDVKISSGAVARLDKPHHAVSVYAAINIWMGLNPNDADAIKRLLRRKDVFITVTEEKTNPTLGCQFALEKLISEQVDTIYWFADFTDKIDPAAAQELAGKLQAKGIKVIAHNFAGKSVPATAMTLVNTTGGQAITTIPGK